MTNGLNSKMDCPIKLLSTDFDGTLHAEFEDPPVPKALEHLIGRMQAAGSVWVINTGRDLSSLMETLGRAKLSVWPDYVVTVEREIHCRKDSQYVGLEEWNRTCHAAHVALFERIRPDLPALVESIKARFHATVYEDPWSPFCLIAKSAPDAEMIHQLLEDYSRAVPELAVVRNDVYARFSHSAFSKGTALREIARRLGLPTESVAAAGDHLNDLSMLSKEYAGWLIAPANAVRPVKEAVRRQDGFVSERPYGEGLFQGLVRILGEESEA